MRTYRFRASEVEGTTIDNLAKLFDGNVSMAIRFLIQFFIVESELKPESTKEVIATMYDRLLAQGHLKPSG